MTTTYNPNVLALYSSFYTAKQVDLVESLAWLIMDEKSMGISEEHVTLINHLAHFYFEAIQTLRQVNNPSWTYLDWLTQAEYDAIMYKRTVLEY